MIPHTNEGREAHDKQLIEEGQHVIPGVLLHLNRESEAKQAPNPNSSEHKKREKKGGKCNLPGNRQRKTNKVGMRDSYASWQTYSRMPSIVGTERLAKL